jgi:RNA polymerase sigma factor (sigma-70 family)
VALRLGATEDEAEEVFQRSWVAIVEGVGSLRNPDRVASWVAGTARNQTYRLFSEQGRHRRAASLDERGNDWVEPSVDPGHDEALDRVCRDAALHDALEQLDSRCQHLVRLLFFTDPPVDYATVAQRTGLAVGSIGPIRARCLKKLGRAFDRLYQRANLDDP